MIRFKDVKTWDKARRSKGEKLQQQVLETDFVL